MKTKILLSFISLLICCLLSCSESADETTTTSSIQTTTLSAAEFTRLSAFNEVLVSRNFSSYSASDSVVYFNISSRYLSLNEK